VLKYYFEVIEPVAGGDVAAARDRSAQRLSAVADAFMAGAGG
jgi:hypothetical protein